MEDLSGSSSYIIPPLVFANFSCEVSKFPLFTSVHQAPLCYYYHELFSLHVLSFYLSNYQLLYCKTTFCTAKQPLVMSCATYQISLSIQASYTGSKAAEWCRGRSTEPSNDNNKDSVGLFSVFLAYQPRNLRVSHPRCPCNGPNFSPRNTCHKDKDSLNFEIKHSLITDRASAHFWDLFLTSLQQKSPGLDSAYPTIFSPKHSQKSSIVRLDLITHIEI